MSELTGYITVDAADALAAAEADAALAAELAAWAALSDDAKLALLVRASDQIDSCRWQGRRYDPDQAREFPRVANEVPSDPGIRYTDGRWADWATAGLVWDWDDDTSAAIVPPAVERAAYLQALSLLDPARAERMDDRHDGVASQAGGGASEGYDGRPANELCRRAWTLVKRYRLRTGRIV